MASRIVQIERWSGTDMAFVRSRAPGEPDVDVLRSINCDIFRGTCVPEKFHFRAGALVSLMLHSPLWEVELIELHRIEDGQLWIADAQVDYGDRQVRRRGIDANPVDALAALAFDIQYE